jgi:hypothetical protein
VLSSWRGRRSGLQILSTPNGAPRAGGAPNPSILEFPIKGTNHRQHVAWSFIVL